jgi:hypothetical protein
VLFIQINASYINSFMFPMNVYGAGHKQNLQWNKNFVYSVYAFMLRK